MTRACAEIVYGDTYEEEKPMNEKAWVNSHISRADWPAGEWEHEPDKLQWTDDATGLACLVKRNTLGAWCGYVGVEPSHPFYRKEFGDLPLEVHGGLTYSDECQEGPEAETICHVPGPGEPDHLWWLGFDCAHFQDECPGNPFFRDTRGSFPLGRTYKDLAFVKRECTELARQVKEANDG